MFIGQEKLVQELLYILSDLREGKKHNVLFRAASGMGKTKLAFKSANAVGIKESMYYLPEEGILKPAFNPKKRYHFLDEAHTLKEQEFLYPLMDSENFCFFIMTNESGNLREPLRNRCIQLIFEPYSDSEAQKIAKLYLKFPGLQPFILNRVAQVSRNNPRQIKILSERLTYVFNRRGIPQSEEEFSGILDILNIDRGDGLNQLETTYLNFLRDVGGRASLPVLMGGTGYDKDLILSEIEPSLLYKKLIRITSRGREVCNTPIQ